MLAASSIHAAPASSNPFKGQYSSALDSGCHLVRGSIKVSAQGTISGKEHFYIHKDCTSQTVPGGWEESETLYDGAVTADGQMTLTLLQHFWGVGCWGPYDYYVEGGFSGTVQRVGDDIVTLDGYVVWYGT